MDILDFKKNLRKEMLIKRAEIETSFKQSYDLWICNQLAVLIEEKNYRIIHAYLPMGKEIDISPLINKLIEKGITIVCPKTLPKRKLENRILTSLNDIEKGVFGTTHPSNPEIYNGKIDLIIVPGLAFDSKNYRLGYGGGYYDNFLINHPEAYKIGIFYPEQKVNNVPTETHDICLNEILVSDNPL